MSVQINLQYDSMCSSYPPSARTHALRCACHFVSGCVNDAYIVKLQCCARHVIDPVAIYCANMSNDVIGTQERQLNSNKSIKQKYVLTYHSKI